MADQQEQFSYEEYKTYKRVAKILAEDGGEPENNDKQANRINSAEDPAGAFAQRLGSQKPKHVYTDEERKMMKDLVSRSR